MTMAAMTGVVRADWQAADSYPIALKGPPFSIAILPGADWAIASQTGGAGAGPGQPIVPFGLAVLHRTDGRYHLDHYVPTAGITTEICVSHDGKHLVAVGMSTIEVFGVDALLHQPEVASKAKVDDRTLSSCVYCTLSRDDRLLFVSEEGAARVAVFNFSEILAHGFTQAAALGKLPTGNAPVGLVVSPDNKWLYSTSEVAQHRWNWPDEFKAENGSHRLHPAGSLEVFDVAKAATDPEHARVARVPAGGNPVRVVLTADGKRAFVTARGSDLALSFDTEKLRTDPDHAPLASIAAGPSPVAIGLAQGDRTLLIGNSNRFGGRDTPSTFTVVDIAANPPRTLGTVPCGGFPREFQVTPDGDTALLANFFSRTIQVVRLPPRSP